MASDAAVSEEIVRGDVEAQVFNNIIEYVAAEIAVTERRPVRRRENEVAWLVICPECS